MIDHEQQFVKNLLRVVKDLEAIQRSKRCREEFLNSDSEQQERPCDPKNDSELELDMQVYDDPEYDVEEVRMEAFMNKMKSTASSLSQAKPGIVRTLIFRAPESSYTVRKCPVFVEVADVPKAIEKKIMTDQSVQTEVIKKPIASNLDPNSKPPAALDKCDMEDLIVMEDDDDILNYEDNIDEEASRQDNLVADRKNSKDFDDEEDDESEDDEDEEYRPATKKSCKRRSTSRPTRRRSTIKAAKVVMERAIEPISTITVTRKRVMTRRRSSVSTQSSELSVAPVSNEKTNDDFNKSKRASRSRKSIETSEISKSKSAKMVEIELSSSMSSVATSITAETSQTATRRSLRVTRSRSKLTTDQ